MKKTIFLVVGILIVSGFAASNVSSFTETTNNFENVYSIDDTDAFKILCEMRPEINEVTYQETSSPKIDYPIGTTIWQYTITGGSDNSVKAIAPIQDINGDGIADIVATSEENNIRCFSGGAIGTGAVLWTHNIYSGNIYSQKGLAVRSDVNSDGYQDVVVGATGGARLVRCISGSTGSTIWTYDTHEYGDGGWVYQVDCKYDYNNDGVIDVLASAGDDSSDTGPKRAFCLNGLTGAKIWDYYLGGAGYSVIGVEDFTGDGKPDVVAGTTNEAETTGYAKGLNGQTGGLVWTVTTSGSSVWALEQTNDINSDGIKDVIIGTFNGYIYGLSATNGAQLYTNSIGSVIITRFAKLNDVNGDGHPDFVPAHSTLSTTQAINGQTGSIIWSQSTADQPWNAARIADVSGDSIDDVVVGTLYTSNYWYFINGVDGSILASSPYGEAVDAIYSTPDVVNDGSMEMMAGGRNGKLTCISGGLNAGNNPPNAPTITGPTEGTVGQSYNFTFVSTDPEDEDLYYFVDWGDGSNSGWFGPYASGEEATKSHTWTSTGTYSIKAKAKDEHGAESTWSPSFEFTILQNNPPNKPDITGPATGKPGVEYTYKFTSTDPDDNYLYYYIEWGDGTNTGWLGPNASGETLTVKHTFTKKGTYMIVCKAKDVYDLESDWGTLEVSIPRTRISFIKRVLDRFPNLFPILRQILN